jgi:cysteine desulfurase
MAVNNENGVSQQLEQAVTMIRALAPGTPVHSDAVQAAGWSDLTELAGDVDLMSITGHKIGGPVGVGALIVRDGTPLHPRLRGGGQENERRSGTQNVAGAVGLARALSLAATERDVLTGRVAALRDRFADAVLAAVDEVVEPAVPDHGDRSGLVGGTVQLCFCGIESEALLFLLDEAGVEASAGSACAAGALESSHVLAAMGVPADVARGALRVSVGRTTTETDIDFAVGVVIDSVGRLRGARAA